MTRYKHYEPTFESEEANRIYSDGSYEVGFDGHNYALFNNMNFSPYTMIFSAGSLDAIEAFLLLPDADTF